MRSSITFNHQKEILSTEPLLTQGDRVYLYGDTNYTGTSSGAIVQRK